MSKDEVRAGDFRPISFEATPFESISQALPMFQSAPTVPAPMEIQKIRDDILYSPGNSFIPERAMIPVRNHFIEYNLMITHDREEEVLSLGVEIGISSHVNGGLARDLLLENAQLNNAKLGIEVGEKRDEYRIVATSEMSTPSLTNQQVAQQIRAFDSAVTFEYGQVHRLAEKNGIELTAAGSSMPSVRPVEGKSGERSRPIGWEAIDDVADHQRSKWWRRGHE